MGQTWFSMRGEKRGGKNVGRIAIYGDIGAFGVTAHDFRNALEALGDVDELWINITSDGGDISTGYAIFNLLSRHLSKKIIVVDALAASMASVIFMAGDERIMPKNSMLMIHNPWGGILGNADEIISFGKALGDMQANLVETYMDATGLSKKEITSMMDSETWLSARKAKQLGFATKVVEPREISARARALKLDRFSNVPASFGQKLKGTATMSNKSKTETSNDAEFEPKSEKEIRAELLASQKEIRSLCALAGFPDLAEQFIDEDKSATEVIAALEAKKAEADEDGEGDDDEEKGAKKKKGAVARAGKELNTRRPTQTSDTPAIDVDAIYAKFNGRAA